VKGRVHASKRQGKTRVVIERAIDGGDWHDEGNRWTKVTTVDVDPSGRFATDILIHRRGLHTLRARVIDPNPKGSARDAALKPRSLDLRDSDGDMLSDSVQATGGHMGTAIYLTPNDGVSSSLKVQCFAMANGKAVWLEAQPLPYTCAFALDQTTPAMTGLFRLVDGDTIYATPSTNVSESPVCPDKSNSQQAEGTLARIAIANTTFGEDFDDGYLIGLDYMAEGASQSTECNYVLLTQHEAKFWNSSFWDQPVWAQFLEAAVAGALIGALIGALGTVAVFGAAAEGGAALVEAAEGEAGLLGFDSVASDAGESIGSEDSFGEAYEELEANWGNTNNVVSFGEAGEEQPIEDIIENRGSLNYGSNVSKLKEFMMMQDFG